MADPHLIEAEPVPGTLHPVVVFPTAQAVPHGFDRSVNDRCGPVGVAAVSDHAPQVLIGFVLIFHRGLEPVFAVQIHHNTALVKAAAAFRKIRLHCKAEEPFLRFHLKDGGVIVLEVVVGSLPQIGMGFGDDGNGVPVDGEASRLPGPLKFCKIHFVSSRFLLTGTEPSIPQLWKGSKFSLPGGLYGKYSTFSTEFSTAPGENGENRGQTLLGCGGSLGKIFQQRFFWGSTSS